MSSAKIKIRPHRGSNTGPHDLQSYALPLSYGVTGDHEHVPSKQPILGLSNFIARSLIRILALENIRGLSLVQTDYSTYFRELPLRRTVEERTRKSPHLDAPMTAFENFRIGLPRVRVCCNLLSFHHIAMIPPLKDTAPTPQNRRRPPGANVTVIKAIEKQISQLEREIREISPLLQENKDLALAPLQKALSVPSSSKTDPFEPV